MISSMTERTRRPIGLLPTVLGALLVLPIELTGAERVERTERAPTRPNILLLVAEDLSPRLGGYGDPIAKTPRLDALAQEGVRFTRVQTTAPVCAPSRAALITGVHQNALGAQHMRTSTAPGGAYRSVPPPEVKAFPELLRAAGYYTFTDAKLDYQFSGPRANSGPFTIWDAEGSGSNWHGREPDQPFFGLINFEVTHESGTFAPLGTWPNSGMHLMMQLVRAFTLGSEPGTLAPDPASVRLPPYYPDVPSVRSEIARHYGNIAFMDRQVGEILDALEREGLSENTFVLFTSDHGDGLPRAKRDLFDSGLHVPMIVRFPDRARAGGVDDRLVSFVDLAPTILARADVAKPAWMGGIDFLDERQARREFVFAARDRMDEVVDRQRRVRGPRFAYVHSDHPQLPGGHPLAFRDNQQMSRDMRALFARGELDAVQARWYQPVGAEQLYDLETDPFEIRNLAEDSAYASELARLRGALERWLAEIEDTQEVDEAEMVRAVFCDGAPCVTPPPSITQRGDSVVIRSDVSGASLGYRVGEGPWRLYTGPFPIPSPAVRDPSLLEAKAIRYGWEESDAVAMSR